MTVVMLLGAVTLYVLEGHDKDDKLKVQGITLVATVAALFWFISMLAVSSLAIRIRDIVRYNEYLILEGDEITED